VIPPIAAKNKNALKTFLKLAIFIVALALVFFLPFDIEIYRFKPIWLKGPRIFGESDGLVTILATIFLVALSVPHLAGKDLGPVIIPNIENPRIRRTAAIIGWIGIVLLIVNFMGAPGLAFSEWAKTSKLKKWERKVESELAYTPSETVSFGSIAEFYKSANASFFSALPPSDTSREIVLATAPGGFGKTFLVNHLADSHKDAFAAYKLISLGKNWLVDDLIVHQGSQQITLNHLLDIEESAQDDLVKKISDTISASKQPVILIDDFDEIDPSDAHSILIKLASLSENCPSPARIVGVGRAEAFTSFISDPRRPYKITPRWISFSPPRYSTKGDLAALTKFVFEDQKRTPTEAELDRVFLLLERNPFLLSMLTNLAQANEIVKYARINEDQTLRSKSQGTVKKDFFNFLLTRNSNTHKRPSPNEPEHLEIYKNILRQIAWERSDEVGKDGCFTVAYLQSVNVGPLATNVRTALDRSGLVEVEPLDTTFLKYKFSPPWVHRYLTEEKNRQIGGFSVCRVALLILVIALGGLWIYRTFKSRSQPASTTHR